LRRRRQLAHVHGASCPRPGAALLALKIAQPDQ
jgi:hypothetical protein